MKFPFFIHISWITVFCMLGILSYESSENFFRLSSVYSPDCICDVLASIYDHFAFYRSSLMLRMNLNLLMNFDVDGSITHWYFLLNRSTRSQRKGYATYDKTTNGVQQCLKNLACKAKKDYVPLYKPLCGSKLLLQIGKTSHVNYYLTFRLEGTSSRQRNSVF